MGYVYYGNYAAFFEVGRAELVRSLGVPYPEMEEQYDVMMPVLDLHVQYNTPARYDELITITTRLVEKPALRVTFEHEVHGPGGNLVVKGRVQLVFIKKSTMKPTRPPQHFIQAIEQHWAK